MAVCQQAHQQAIHQVLLADNRASDLSPEPLDPKRNLADLRFVSGFLPHLRERMDGRGFGGKNSGRFKTFHRISEF